MTKKLNFKTARYVDMKDLKFLPQATYVMLRSTDEIGDYTITVDLEDAGENSMKGAYRIGLGLPTRALLSNVAVFDTGEDAINALVAIKATYPDVRVWLDSNEIYAEIEGADVWRGLVRLMASIDPSDPDIEWNDLEEMAAGLMPPKAFVGEVVSAAAKYV